MVDINKHPLLKQVHELCLEIERLPASENQTKASMMANELLNLIDRAMCETER